MGEERHPIPDRPAGLTDAERIAHLELYLARLWDQVWWLSLPFWRRWAYRLRGFSAPIRVAWLKERSEFYEEVD